GVERMPEHRGRERTTDAGRSETGLCNCAWRVVRGSCRDGGRVGERRLFFGSSGHGAYGRPEAARSLVRPPPSPNYELELELELGNTSSNKNKNKNKTGVPRTGRKGRPT